MVSVSFYLDEKKLSFADNFLKFLLLNNIRILHNHLFVIFLDYMKGLTGKETGAIFIRSRSLGTRNNE